MLAAQALRLPAASGRVSIPLALLRVVRWTLAGGGSLALKLVIQGLLVDWLALPARGGIVLAYELALIAHFFVNDRCVFETDGQAGAWRRLAAFHVSALGAEAVTLAVAFAVLAVLAAPLATLARPTAVPYVATTAGVVAATVVTFSASFLWIWRR